MQPHARARISTAAFALTFISILCSTSFGAVKCVKPTGDNANDGSSWALAKKTLLDDFTLRNGLEIAGGVSCYQPTDHAQQRRLRERQG